ncbi:2455_t:CDS:2, partial [Acaulospora morrowiae]
MSSELVRAIRDKIDADDDRMRALEKELDASKTKIQTLENDLAASQTKMQALENDLAANKIKTQALENKINSFSADFSASTIRANQIFVSGRWLIQYEMDTALCFRDTAG